DRGQGSASDVLANLHFVNRDANDFHLSAHSAGRSLIASQIDTLAYDLNLQKRTFPADAGALDGPNDPDVPELRADARLCWLEVSNTVLHADGQSSAEFTLHVLDAEGNAFSGEMSPSLIQVSGSGT